MDIDDINFEDIINELNEMNNNCENMICELREINDKLLKTNNEIDCINNLKVRKARANNKLSREYKKFKRKEILLLLTVIFTLAISNPSIITFLTTLIPITIGGSLIMYKMYLNKTKDARKFLVDNLSSNEDNYNSLIRKQKSLNTKRIIKSQDVHFCYKQIKNFIKEISLYEPELSIYAAVINNQYKKTNENCEDYSYILKKS